MNINYIHRLEDKAHSQQVEIDALLHGMREIERYLLSPKFHEDTTVQVGDILHRLEEIRAWASDMANDSQNKMYHHRVEQYQKREANNGNS